MDDLNVCILFGLDDRHVRKISETAPGARISRPAKDEVSQAIKEAHVVFGWPGEDELNHAERLRWIHVPSAGADRFVAYDRIKRGDVVVTNSSGTFGIPISEHIVGLMLALNRNLHTCVKAQADRKWTRNELNMDEVYGKTAGILGLGDIGTETARRVKALGMHVIAVKRRATQKPEFVDELYDESGIDHVIRSSDFLLVCLPGTQGTRGLVSRERLASMKPGSYVVNIGRGSIIDEAAMTEMLQNGHLRGAGLDVFETEPLPAESPLWTMPNVIVTPHVSGKHPKHADRSTEIFCRNLGLFQRGEPLTNVVDPAHGY